MQIMAEVFDKNGTQLFIGDRIAWYDTELAEEVYYTIYGIHNEEMICCYNDYGEAELPPCEVVKL